MDQLIKLDYMDETNKGPEVVYQIENALEDFPKFGVFDKMQRTFIVTSSKDILYVNMVEEIEVDIDDAEGISDIKNIIYKNNHFYIIANKKD